MVDSQTGAGGLGCLVVAAARSAEQGAELGAVVDAVRQTRERLEIWFALDTLEYLRRGGRIGAAQAMPGTALKVKPILTFGTEITPVGRVRTKTRALERMNEYLHGLHDRGARDSGRATRPVTEDAENLVAYGTEIFGAGPLFCIEVGRVLGEKPVICTGNAPSAAERPQPRTAAFQAKRRFWRRSNPADCGNVR